MFVLTRLKTGHILISLEVFNGLMATSRREGPLQ